MNQKQVIESLRKEAASNPTSSAVLHVWGLRERARSQVTLEGLNLKMKEEGFSFEKKDYVPLLSLLGQLGIGTLQKTSSGRVIALKGIPVTLQSIGKAAVGGEASLNVLKKKRRYKQLMAMPAKPPTPPKATAPVVTLDHAPPADAVSPVVGLTVRLATREVHLGLPKDITDKEVTLLLGWMRAAGRSS